MTIRSLSFFSAQFQLYHNNNNKKKKKKIAAKHCGPIKLSWCVNYSIDLQFVLMIVIQQATSLLQLKLPFGYVIFLYILFFFLFFLYYLTQFNLIQSVPLMMKSQKRQMPNNQSRCIFFFFPSFLSLSLFFDKGPIKMDNLEKKKRNCTFIL